MRRALLALGALALAGCGSAGHVHAAAARPPTCLQEWNRWARGPAGATGRAMLSDLRAVSSAADAEDIPGVLRGAADAGRRARALQGLPPVPGCSDPAGAWGKMLTSVAAAGDDAGDRALGPLQQMQLTGSAIRPAEREIAVLSREEKAAGVSG